jgi:hypothetical protein
VFLCALGVPAVAPALPAEYEAFRLPFLVLIDQVPAKVFDFRCLCITIHRNGNVRISLRNEPRACGRAVWRLNACVASSR